MTSASIKAESEPAEVTLEQRENSIELDGFLYAAIDFTKPVLSPEEGCPAWVNDPAQSSGTRLYNPNETSKGLSWSKLPGGWELAKSSEEIVEKVIKPYPWGTHLIVTGDEKAYHTAKGQRPGTLEMLWDIEKDAHHGYKLARKAGMNSRWHGRILIKSTIKFTS